MKTTPLCVPHRCTVKYNQKAKRALYFQRMYCAQANRFIHLTFIWLPCFSFYALETPFPLPGNCFFCPDKY